MTTNHHTRRSTRPHRGDRGGPRTRLAAALVAAERGWKVFPFYPGGKHPAVKDWENRATTDRAQLEEWWATMPYNIGVACGPSDLVVIDLDSAHGQQPPPPWSEHSVTHGRDVLSLLAEQAGHPDPVDTYTVSTPRLGEHRYFRAPPLVRLPPTVGKLGWRIDTRSAGANIIAAGSVRKIDGQVRRYSVTRDLEIPVLPAWIEALLTPAPVAPRTPVRLHVGSGREAYVAAALAGEADEVAAAHPGTRADTLFKAAASLGELVGAHVLDENTAVTTLLAAARGHQGIEQWTEAEALRHIQNGIARGRQQPRRLEMLDR